jgi:hypothetical protein
VISEVKAFVPSGYEVKFDASRILISQRIGMSRIEVSATVKSAAGDWVRGRALARFSQWEVITFSWDCGRAP